MEKFMPQYFLHIRDHEGLILDPDGSCLDNLNAARAEAIESARELMAESISSNGRIGLNRSFEISDAAGATLLMCPSGRPSSAGKVPATTPYHSRPEPAAPSLTAATGWPLQMHRVRQLVAVSYRLVSSFWITAGIQLYVIEALNRAVDGLSAERDRVGVLFRELQHRVANNMSFVASMLRLQRRQVETRPESALAVFDQAQTRLETMARIHRRLYDPQSADLPLTAYFEGLVKDILEAAGAKHIVCVVEVTPAKFDLARLVTLSLLINELVTNAIKHGLAGRDSGTVSVRLDREADDYVLAIADNGKGMANPAASGASLGLTIIRSLAAQLGGDVSWSAAGGTTARVTFPA
jgi:two-component sensor histidine kinase